MEEIRGSAVVVENGPHYIYIYTSSFFLTSKLSWCFFLISEPSTLYHVNSGDDSESWVSIPTNYLHHSQIGEQPNNPALLSMVFAFAKTFQTEFITFSLQVPFVVSFSQMILQARFWHNFNHQPLVKPTGFSRGFSAALRPEKARGPLDVLRPRGQGRFADVQSLQRYTHRIHPKNLEKVPEKMCETNM